MSAAAAPIKQLRFPKKGTFRHVNPNIAANKPPPVKRHIHPRTAQAAERRRIPVKDRIAQFNIQAGDKVRLLTGRPEDKYLDEVKGKEGGWKVYEVNRVDPSSSKVFLSGMQARRSIQPPPKPNNFDELSPEQQQAWKESAEFPVKPRGVHYSNVGLVIQEDEFDPTKIIFAKRIAKTRPFYNAKQGVLMWNRQALSASGVAKEQLVDEQGRLKTIPWPEVDVPKISEPTDLDTPGNIASKATLQLPATQRLADIEDAEGLWPVTLRSPAPSDQRISDFYINATTAPQPLDPGPDVDTLMPLYLSEELAPRFASHKKKATYIAKRRNEEREREEYARERVKAWLFRGGDSGLRQVMDSQEAALEEVYLKKRTKQEVYEQALEEWDDQRAQLRKEVKRSVVQERTYDFESGEWKEGRKDVKIRERRAKKLAKEERLERRLEGLQLRERGNMVVPPEIKIPSGEARA